MAEKEKLKGVIFDLDGVLVDTVPLHFMAWKKMFGEYGKGFSFKDYKEKVDGIPRLDGARAILEDLSRKELEDAAAKKQRYYLDYLKKKGIKVYKDAVLLIDRLKRNNIKIAAISSSRNCSFILHKSGLDKKIDVTIDGNDIKKGKPDPQIFLTALKKLRLKKEECIVFEDAQLGIEAAKRGGFKSVGIDRHRDPKRLIKADLIVDKLSNLNLDTLKALLR